MRTLTHAEFMAMRRFPALDGLRAFAAVIVVFFHFGGAEWKWLSGWVGVYLFFVLSGFLITTLLLREQDTKGRISLKNFYIRRVFRIMPPYFVIFAFIMAFFYLRGDFFTIRYPETLKYYLTFMNEFLPEGMKGAPNDYFSGSWTLGIEQKFYLVWPALMVFAGVAAARRRVYIALGAMAVLVACIPLTAGWYTSYSMTALYTSTVHYVVLLIGALLAIVMNSKRLFKLVQPLTHPLVAPVAMIGFAVLHVNMETLWHSTGNAVVLLLAYAVLTAMLIVSLLGRNPMTWLLSTAPMRFVGDRSYSLYLFQGIAGFMVGALLPRFQVYGTLTAVVVTLASLLLADVVFRWVEHPAIELGRRIIARRSKMPAAVNPPAKEVPPVPVGA
ncbi:acyltransferase family protein [Lentzea flava]|uniref:Acyltransferase n=1 Tax=Lentzea flava TaxID=103732 RepID=A0ABQ2UBM7_9PSEU|nr:acyltransferase [Lentzea flava]MCP2197439.1 Peptidoglycan/LPS O-acetylase OafA/YrhL, contains acyltransferase and SGNH-hydrolase domains [Lentzea flava]GGU19679.1 acyltransferase [Lentzea flava]